MDRFVVKQDDDMARLGLPLVSLLVAAGFVVQPAQADIYTWTDKAGVINVSNLPPPESARVTKVTRAAPRDAAREAAAVEAARQAEVRALADRVHQLQGELEQSRRDTPPPVAFVAPQMPYAPAPTYIVNVVSPPAPAYAAPAGGCGYGFGWDCGFGFWPGFYTSSPVVIRGKHPHHHRRVGPVAGNQHLIPPLIPLPTQTRPSGRSRGRG
jgi:hypothetical protein